MFHASWYALINLRLSSASASTSRKNWASALTESIPTWIRNLGGRVSGVLKAQGRKKAEAEKKNFQYKDKKATYW